MNVASDKVACVGGTISDAAITLAAVDPCYCCTERVAVMRRSDNLLYSDPKSFVTCHFDSAQ